MNEYRWINHQHFWELLAPQKDSIWLEGRKGRITSTASSGLAGKSIFKTPEEQGKIIAGVVVEVFTEDELKRMNHGVNTEYLGRDWCSKYIGREIVERGLIVPTWDLELGASIDGDIVGTDGIIEIKCPNKMYYPLEQYTDQLKSGWIPPKNYHEHIWLTHFHQMQHAMAVMGKKYCYYIVYSTSDKKIFTQKIRFDQTHWDHYYPIIKANYQKYVKPYLNGKYPIMPF